MSVIDRLPARPQDATSAPLGAATRPLLVELVGPAGAGKTALLRTLGQDPRVRAGLRIDRARDLPALILNTAALLPSAVGLLAQGPASLSSGLLHLIRLRTLHGVLARAAAIETRRVLLLDEGPIFSLGRLSVFQRANEGRGRLARGWHAQLAQWSTELDAIVWIDAADEVLVERIRTRRKAHRVKEGTDRQVTTFLAQYREAYRKVLDHVKASGTIRMIEIDTTALPVDATATRVLAELERLMPESRTR